MGSFKNFHQKSTGCGAWLWIGKVGALLRNKRRALYDEGARSARKQTWLGMEIKVTLGPGFIHNVRIGPLIFPHPPVANYILRQGISSSRKYELGFTHEFAHFQTLPAAAVYAIVVFTSLKYIGSNFWNIALALVSLQAFWESISEVRTFANNAQYYRECYKGVSALPRLVFWISALALFGVFWIKICLRIKI